MGPLRDYQAQHNAGVAINDDRSISITETLSHRLRGTYVKLPNATRYNILK
jgi:hypothetical protein